MNRRSKSWMVATVCGIILVIPLARTVSAQTYPKLAVNGNGLALTRLLIEERLNGMWVATPSLRQGVDYRLTVRLTSYFPNNLMQWVVLNKTYFNLTLNGATFFASDQYYGSGTPSRYQSDPDRDPLEPTKSKSHYVYFRWNTATTPTPLVNMTASVDGWEERGLPNPAESPVRPTS